MSNETLKTLFSHQSLRHYTGEHLSASQVEAIERAVLQTASTLFFQLISVIKVTDRALREKIAAASSGQAHIVSCDQFWLFVMDFTKLYHAEPSLPKRIPFKLFQSAVTDAGMCCQSALIAAESMGLGAVPIGSFRSGIAEISQLLNLPHYSAPSIGLCLGVPDEQYREQQKPRLPKDWLIFENKWQDPFCDKGFEQYNEIYKRYNKERKYNASDKNWGQSIAPRLPKVEETASALLAFYQERGFAFE